MMKNLEKYKRDMTLSEQELDTITRDLLKGKFNEERRNSWKSKLAAQHDVERTSSATTIEMKPKDRGRLRPLYIISAIAATIALLLVVLPLFQSSGTSPQQLAMEYLEKPFPHNAVRGDEVSTTRLRATEAYNEQNFGAAMQQYNTLIASEEAEVGDYFYLGLSELYTEQYPLAVQHLEQAQALAASGKEFQQEIDWYLSLAYLQAEHTAKAKTLLQQIVNNKQWKQADAIKLLEQI